MLFLVHSEAIWGKKKSRGRGREHDGRAERA